VQLVAAAHQPDPTAWTERDLNRLRELVRAEEGSAWEIGDELLALLPVGPVGVRTGVAARIREIAAEVDAEPRSLTEYRKVAHAWPDGARVPSATWAAHRACMGPPQSAPQRAGTLLSLPRNEHGKITVQAVRALYKGGGHAKPSWLELVGKVGDELAAAEKAMARAEAAVTRRPTARMSAKLVEYAARAQVLAERLDAMREWREPDTP